MDISLDKIDLIVERTGVSYREAKEALEKSNGDVLEAIIYIENQNKSFTENMGNKGEQLLDKLKEYIRKGNVTKIIIKKDGEVIMNIPVSAGTIGTILAPQIALLGFSAALLSKCTFEIVKEDGETININETVEKEIHKSKNPTDENSSK
ncbi:DUF4342 domain-containing protein [Anaerosalibacter massiliensis]|uniref:DUF4342 domain-containing protein n=1 Tax=Anaerosalibacter massiliensis TaxID=1347392 RepID=A0A9X2S8B7_9FIRM|nr:DUF4342 domain-containing protein [Anaerosalibacter massiliensis]MCR2044941.1 DUF4342 domain-containing protein [Anaerosalibacter massiliensis]